MPDYNEWPFERLINVVAAAVRDARTFPEASDPENGNSFVAWVVLQELRRADYQIRHPDSGLVYPHPSI